MTALPDTFMPEGPLRAQRETPAHYTDALPDDTLRTILLRLGAVAAMAAAAGLWLIPAVPGDTAMQMAKLALSVFLAIGGAVVFGRTRRAEGPEVHVDTARRHLTVIARDSRGQVRSERCYGVDALSEIVLRESVLTARDAEGTTLFALPVSDPRIKAALVRMLAQAA